MKGEKKWRKKKSNIEEEKRLKKEQCKTKRKGC